MENHIICHFTQKLDQFSLPDFHSLSELPKGRHYLDKDIQKLGIFQNLSILVQVAKKERADNPHTHFGTIDLLKIGAARKAGFKLVVTVNGYKVSLVNK